jgi:rhamnogalacturonyl hydrolase YesR
MRTVLLLLLASVNLLAVQAQPHLPFRWDMGPAGLPPERHSVRIDESCTYSAARGYGFTTSGLSAYRNERLASLGIGGIADGVRNDGPIAFRIDAPAGPYIVEVVMDAGRFTTWTGTVAVNGAVIAGPLACFGTNTEGEMPPPFWIVMVPVTVRESSMVIEVNAGNQPTTLAAVGCYHDARLPVDYIQGRAAACRPLRIPNGDLALRLINSGHSADARKVIEALPDTFPLEKAALLYALASRPETPGAMDLIARGRDLLERAWVSEPSSAPALGIRLADLLLDGNRLVRAGGWQWAREAYGDHGIFDLNNAAGMCFTAASAVTDHPLTPAALWLRAKTAYWVWVEQHDAPMIKLADSTFAQLERLFPSFPLLAMYQGKTHFDADRLVTPDGLPRWAFLQHELTGTTLDVLHYWVTERQAEDGEFGGKYDDDVEMLRWWPFARLAFDDSLALVGMKRLVDGIWHSGWIEKGFSRKVRDVEHSSEPVADTQPMMIGFDYGNPVYIERCMESVKGLRDLWTGINARGHRHFRSSWYSATRVDSTPPKDCDLAMNTRTVKAAQWLAWYNRHPFVMQFLKEWGDAWLEDCLRTDKGKPPGIVPAAIRFRDDAIGGNADNWHHPGMFWDYYDYSGGSAILQQLLLNAMLFKDRSYLRPIELSLDLVRMYEDTDPASADTGSAPWAAGILRRSEGFWGVIEQWRLVFGDARYDDLILRLGSPYIRYALTGDRTHLTTAMTRAINTLRENLDLLTTEGYFTDRVELRSMRGGDDQTASFLEAMLLGGSLNRAAYPFNRVSWTGFGREFSVIVGRCTDTSVAAVAFNHGDRPVRGWIVLQDRPPGTYRIRTGIDRNADQRIDSVCSSQELPIEDRRVLLPLGLPPHTEVAVTVERIKITSGSAFAGALPDLALSREEIRIARNNDADVSVDITVHNIGIAASVQSHITLLYGEEGGPGTVVAEAEIPRLSAPLDLEPKVHVAHVTMPNARPGRYRAVIDRDGVLQEINKTNNEVVFRVGDKGFRSALPDPIGYGRRAAEKVIRETSFAFRQREQRAGGSILELDLGSAAIRGRRGGLLARALLSSDRDTIIQLSIAHSGPLSVLVNDQRIYSAAKGVGDYREHAYDMYQFPSGAGVRVRKGHNRLLIAAGDGDTLAFAALAVVDRAGRTVPGFGFDDTASVKRGVRWVFLRTAKAADTSVPGGESGWSVPPVRWIRNDVIPPNASFTGHSYFAWHYANGQMALGMMALADRTGSSALRGWVDTYCSTTLATYDEFRRQYEVLHERTGFNYRLFRGAMLDDTSAPALPFVESLLRGAFPEGKPIVDRVATFIANGQSRLADGTLCRPEPLPGTVWADDMFMSVPFLLRYAALTGDDQYADDAAAQVIGMYHRLLDPSTGLASHAWFSNGAARSAVRWGRANGWMLWAATEALQQLPRSHPRYDEILDLYRRHAEGLLRVQPATGLWHQVLDHPETYEETSCSAMFVIGLARGVKRGWLDPGNANAAWRAWDAVCKKIDADGTVYGICQGTAVGDDVSFYARRKAPPHDPRGLGAVCTAAVEMQALLDLQRGLPPERGLQ